MSSREFDHAKLCNPHGEYPQILDGEEFIMVRDAARERLEDRDLLPDERDALESALEKFDHFDDINRGGMEGLVR